MLCENPYVSGAGAFPCGLCDPCRFQRKRIWTHRILLESTLHSDNSFVTLTYSDDHLPSTIGPTGAPIYATLRPKDLTDWLKRFRKSISPIKIRYFAVGEYGSTSHRPHYHLALFGYPTCFYGESQFTGSRQSCCSSCNQILATWGRGQVHLGSLTTSSAQYCARYVTKKMTCADDPLLLGRHPEFTRMSLRPGIGHDVMPELASRLMELNLDTTQSDVPVTLQHGRRKLPLGRYLRRTLRSHIGKDPGAPEIVLQQIEEELQPVRQAAFDASRSFKADLIKEGAQKRLQIATRNKIRKGSDKL